jgi:HicB-like protein involved in pilus formation
MQLGTHLGQVARQLEATAALGDERTREIAAALATAAAPAVRLAVLNALSEAADEITAALLDVPGSPAVAVRLDGDDALVDVRLAAAPLAEEPRREDGEASARISLRLSEALKNDVDAAAARDGVSVNTWLVRAATAALNPGPFAALAADLSGFGPGGTGPGGRGRPRAGEHNRVTGWING